MLTKEQIAEADAAYAALPGTLPNEWSFRSNHDVAGRDLADVIQEMQKAHSGCTHFRMTKTDDGIWLEAWDVRPSKEAPFAPPYTFGVER